MCICKSRPMLICLLTLQGVWTGYPRQGLWRWSGSVDHHFPEFRAISPGALWALHGAKKVKRHNKSFPNHRWGKWLSLYQIYFLLIISHAHTKSCHSSIGDWALFIKVCSHVVKPRECSAFLWWDGLLKFYFKSVPSYWPFTAKEYDTDIWRGTLALQNSVPFVLQLIEIKVSF